MKALKENKTDTLRHEVTNTGIVFYDNDKVIAKFFYPTTGKLRVVEALTKRQLTYISEVLYIKKA